MKIVNWYRNLKIKNKLLLLLIALILFISISSVFALQISYKIYDEQLINQSSVILKLYSTNIESELRKMEALTFSILSDPKVQSYLKHIYAEESSYERTMAVSAMTQRLMAEAQAESYISSMGFIDNDEIAYGVGRQTKLMDDSEKKRLISAAREHKGGITWLKSSGEDNIIIAAREIRAIENMESLAVLFIRIDLDNLINRYISMESTYKPNLQILSNNKIIYDNTDDLQFDINEFFKNRVRSYYVDNINDEKYLIYYGTSTYTDWTYVNILPYDNIFQNISKMRTTMIVILVLLLMATSFIGTRFANSITRPIIMLSSKMEKVRDGNFDLSPSDSNNIYHNDEIGQLNHDFNVMINRINSLINENYVKQLLIKETELKALQSQINPHFLYNTLASINGLAKMNGQQKISAMVKSLSNLLRGAIRNKEIVITIREEINLLKDYITIQKIRYGERLDFSMEADEEILDCSILKLTLQPIVENSITHGLENLTGPCKISVTAKRIQDLIRIEVTDNGPGISEDILTKLRNMEIESKGFGIGLSNIDKRTKLIFGEKYGLVFESELRKETTVGIELPVVENMRVSPDTISL